MKSRLISVAVGAAVLLLALWSGALGQTVEGTTTVSHRAFTKSCWSDFEPCGAATPNSGSGVLKFLTVFTDLWPSPPSELSNFSTTDWLTWQTNPFSVPKTSAYTLYDTLGDSWAVYEGGRAYAAFLTKTAPTGSQRCVAVATTDDSHMLSRNWEYPANCVGPPNSAYDGPSIAAFDAWLDYIVAVTSADYFDPDGTGGEPVDYQARLWIMDFCGYGSVGCCVSSTSCDNECPGAGACPVTATSAMKYPMLYSSHPTVDISPCTGNAVSAYIKKGPETPLPLSGDVRLEIRNKNDATLIQERLVQSDVDYITIGCGATPGEVPTCGEENCLRNSGNEYCAATVLKPQVVTTQSNGHCYAYVTWEEVREPAFYMTTFLYIFDITNETGPLPLVVWYQSHDGSNFDQYEPSVLVERQGTGNKVVGWFHYSNIFDPCHAFYEGCVDANGMLSGCSATGSLSGQFPRFVLPGYKGNTGDYTIGVWRGGHDGRVYPMWTQAVSGPSNCYSCDGATWRNVVRMARVLP